jgi:hypothetical protein
MTKILAVGCSITKGHGLNLEVDDPHLWVNQLANSTFNNSSVFNLSQTGKNNNWIFTEAASAMVNDRYDVVIIGWTDIDRLNFNVGLELYPTQTMLKNMDININPGTRIKGSALEKLGNQIQKLKNTHWNILEMVKYINILYYIQVEVNKSKLFFVNTLTGYPDMYFHHIHFTNPSELDWYTQELLSVPTRDDVEIKKLYEMIHKQYNYYGGIHEDCWLNLNTPLTAMSVDTVSLTDNHPGYKSQTVFANYLIPILKEKLECEQLQL